MQRARKMAHKNIQEHDQRRNPDVSGSILDIFQDETLENNAQ